MQADTAAPRSDGQQAPDTDAVWKALSNPVRRSILDLLRDGPRTTGDLSDEFPELTRFAVMQHLGVLVEADLVVPRRSGRKRYNYLNPVPIQQVYDRWVSRYVRPWTEALVGLRDELESEARNARAESPPVEPA
ncbi:MAG: helix-turn-helix domain-containing protein [Longimicrobiales bacterium]